MHRSDLHPDASDASGGISDAGEPDFRSPSRRLLIAAAAGLLVPAAAAVLLPEDAEAGRNRRRKRHRRHKRRADRPVRDIWADDTLVNLINQTNSEWDVLCSSGEPGWYPSKLAAGRESGWNPGTSIDSAGGEVFLRFRWRREPSGDTRSRYDYKFRADNPDIGKPDVRLVVMHGEGKSETTLLEQEMSEGQIIEHVHDGLKFFIHRWRDGDETFDGDTEEYCRFVVRVRPA